MGEDSEQPLSQEEVRKRLTLRARPGLLMVGDTPVFGRGSLEWLLYRAFMAGWRSRPEAQGSRPLEHFEAWRAGLSRLADEGHLISVAEVLERHEKDGGQ